MKAFGLLSVWIVGSLWASVPAQASGALWCALMRTPTEIADRAEIPYTESQIDQMSAISIQVYEIDHYRDDQTSTRTLEWVKDSSENQISGIALGTYRDARGTELTLSVDNAGKIALSNGQYCEIPGDYKASYSGDVRRIGE